MLAVNSTSNDPIISTAYVAFVLATLAAVGFAFVVYLLAAASWADTGGSRGRAVSCSAVVDSDTRANGNRIDSSDATLCAARRQQLVGQAILLGLPSTLIGSAAIGLACTRLRR